MSELKLIKTDFLPVTTADVTRLPDFECDAVMLQASSRTDDDMRIQPDTKGSFKNLGNEIIWGVGGNMVNQLFVTESIQIGVSNANEIQFRCQTPTENQILAISYFVK